jgi:two-component system sensor histidine kinase YesM
VPEYGTIIGSLETLRARGWLREVAESYAPRWFAVDGRVFAACQFIDLYSDRNLGVFYLEVRHDWLAEALGGPHASGKDRTTALLDREGAAIHPPDSRSPGRLFFPGDDLARAAFGIVKLEGRRYLSARLPIVGTRWQLLSHIPYRAIVHGTHKITTATILITVSCFAILTAFTLLLSNVLARRIEALNRSMVRVESGDFEIEISDSSNDEIGQLSARFGRMVGKINNLITEVYQSRIVQKEAELEALQAQINPHFLYNSLSIIRWKAAMADLDELSQVAAMLATFYRTALNSGTNVISIADEVDNTRAYVYIQLVMHDGGFDAEFAIDDAVLQYRMPKLILQPIVENAIVHGIEKKTTGKGALRIEARCSRREIRFLVCDNGAGMDAQRLASLFSETKGGYGLFNVRERIRLFFGDPYGVQVESSPGGGTRVSVNIPAQEYRAGGAG